MTVESSFFRIERDGAVARIVMNKPDKANSMTPEFWTDLPRVIGGLGRDTSVRCAVISGEGRHFSGGMDLAAFAGIAQLFKNEPGRARRSISAWRPTSARCSACRS